ncbi:Protein kinase-like domain superfamily [Arabidopsis suecica]|uniref:Protein kinase-like domain superfamily n=1 Tax=Arabidopsis suecica TaxID=45249 RepID=A0A8T2AHB0_ARASU|nr:Protein kinase-like domain superfamily [Arabidopsis suecica]
MESLQVLLLALIIVAFATTTHVIQAQPDPNEFINLDCGLHPAISPYIEPLTTLTYISDANFTQGGQSGRVQKVWEEAYKPFTVLRYFPDGIRNCYNLRVTSSTKYLIKALFLYGNYDGLNNGPIFDMYLGPNIWTTVDLKSSLLSQTEEIIHITKSSSLEICLVKTGKTTPIISALELRPLRDDTYITQNGSLKLLKRYYASDFFGPSIRYPSDVYDREWKPISLSFGLTFINTSLNVNSSTPYELPQEVVSKAIIDKNVTEKLSFDWYVNNREDEALIYLHFAEIQTLKGNDTREFDIIWKGNDGNITISAYRPSKLQLETLYNTSPMRCKFMQCTVELVMTKSSTLPPMINAMEAYQIIEFPDAETNPEDVVAVQNIRATYHELSKIDWQGDPCVPRLFKWEGINCSYTNASIPPRIISLDLSNNNLTEGVPEFLANMESLLIINLGWNSLTGPIPLALRNREKKGLKLVVQGNPNLCLSDSCDNKKVLVPVFASLASMAALIALLALIFVLRKKKPLSKVTTRELPRKSSIFAKKKKFTFSEVVELTDNFKRVLGEGGFGVVYHGSLSDTEPVAVKVLSESSVQGYKEFKAEVELLLRVHHINLVSLVGYCDEGGHLALIYEYMANGDLKQHLSGESSGPTLKWASRLKIAIEAAQGLEYLHVGCEPPMVHRDVKSTNILLDDRFEAKLADFGLSRSFSVGAETQVATVVAGTPGYLDPEYYLTNWLNEKSDVYSFGIVLIEIITNRSVIELTREKAHIAEWVKILISRGDIEKIVDTNLSGDYDSNSVWRILELAMSCVSHSSSDRPNMSKVVNILKECLISENSRTGQIHKDDSKNSDLTLNFGTEVTPLAR